MINSISFSGIRRFAETTFPELVRSTLHGGCTIIVNTVKNTTPLQRKVIIVVIAILVLIVAAYVLSQRCGSGPWFSSSPRRIGNPPALPRPQSVLSQPILPPLEEGKTLEYNVPTPFLQSEVRRLLQLRHPRTEGYHLVSDHPDYQDSVFDVTKITGSYDMVTRRRKGESPLPNEIIANLFPLQGPRTVDPAEKPLESEGLKVRTFCLELLSNIEDLQIAKRGGTEVPPELARGELIQLNAFKSAVRYFLENGALGCKAGFSDFMRLISALEMRANTLQNSSDAQALRQNLRRHSELVKLQSLLTRKEEGRVSHWDKIKTMVRAGLFVNNIEETAAHAASIGLHPIPPLPKMQPIVNLYPTIDAINFIESGHREATRWLMNHVNIFSFKQLCGSIRASCHQLQETILTWDDYYLLTIRGKSQEWMADIAYRYLPVEKMPKGVLMGEHGSSPITPASMSLSNHFLFFDDSAYSGTQLRRYLGALIGLLRADSHPGFAETKTIYCILGSFPCEEGWGSQFNDCLEGLQSYNIHVEFITNNRSESVNTLMKKENLSVALMEQISDLAHGERPLRMTEWKKPDYMSLPRIVANGDLTNRGGDFARKNFYELNVSESSVRELDGEGPMTEVIPPYA